jgi:drug/metabolite transporter (DMT)-like permease
MSSTKSNPSAGRPLSPGAIALMLLLCLSWGFNQIAVKLALPDMPAMTQATFRSIGALPVAIRMRFVLSVCDLPSAPFTSTVSTTRSAPGR